MDALGGAAYKRRNRVKDTNAYCAQTGTGAENIRTRDKNVKRLGEEKKKERKEKL